jgi:hypothetical protein
MSEFLHLGFLSGGEVPDTLNESIWLTVQIIVIGLEVKVYLLLKLSKRAINQSKYKKAIYFIL